MKRTASILLALLLTAFFCITVVTAEGNDDGFSIEEMPEFGQTEEVYFPTEQTGAPVTAPQPPASAAPAETQLPQTNSPQETPLSPEEAGGSPAPSSAQNPTPAPTPGPEPLPNRAASGLRDNLPVMIVVAVLVLSALAAALVKKRKATKRPPEAKRPNDIGGRK